MKPAEFDYLRAATLDEAIEALAAQPDDAKVIAGGQSLVPMMNFRLATPGMLVDINRVPGLDSIVTRDGGVAIGATARQADVEASPLAARACPMVVEALHHVGHPQLRSRGTVVGSLVHHDPAAEMPAVAVALEARIAVAGPRGRRVIPARDFFHTYFTTGVEPDEVATEVWFPEAGPGTGTAFVEMARRPGDFAMVGVGALVEVADGRIDRAAIAVSGVSDHPVRCAAAEAALAGRATTPEVFAEAGRLAERDDQVAPTDDVHATAAYRRRVLPVLVQQALTAATERARRDVLAS